MECKNCEKRENCEKICREIELELQKITTVSRDDVFHHLYEKAYDPDKLFQRYYNNDTSISFPYWGFTTLEEALDVFNYIKLNKLSFRERYILELYYEKGLTQDQIANILGEYQVKIARQLQKIREKLRKEFDFLRKSLSNKI